MASPRYVRGVGTPQQQQQVAHALQYHGLTSVPPNWAFDRERNGALVDTDTGGLVTVAPPFSAPGSGFLGQLLHATPYLGAAFGLGAVGSALAPAAGASPAALSSVAFDPWYGVAPGVSLPGGAVVAGSAAGGAALGNELSSPMASSAAFDPWYGAAPGVPMPTGTAVAPVLPQMVQDVPKNPPTNVPASQTLKGLILGDAISGGTGLINSLLNRSTSRENVQAQIAENAKERQFEADRLNQILGYNRDQQQQLYNLLFGSGSAGGGLYGQMQANVAPYTSLGSTAANTLSRLMGVSAPSVPRPTPPMLPPTQPSGAPLMQPQAGSQAGLSGLSGLFGMGQGDQVEMIAPTGQRKLVPRDQVAHYQSLGARVVS